MQRLIKSAAKIFAVSIIACGLALIANAKVNAQSEKGLQGSYAGGSFSTGGGLTQLGIYGRYDLPKLPISVRGGFGLLNGNGDTETIFRPSVSYDLPIGSNANIYAGAGLAFGSGDSTPFLNAGAEAEVATNLVVVGNLDVPLDNDADPNFTIGFGYRF